jgi:DNA-binding response OmpR family regulator
MMSDQRIAILIVDSDPAHNESVTNPLDQAGFKTTFAHNTRDAAFKLQSAKYGCIVLDLYLGKELGEAVIHMARNPKASENVRTPILATSAQVDKEYLGRVAPFIRGLLLKPFPVENLVAQVKKLSAEN